MNLDTKSIVFLWSFLPGKRKSRVRISLPIHRLTLLIFLPKKGVRIVFGIIKRATCSSTPRFFLSSGKLPSAPPAISTKMAVPDKDPREEVLQAWYMDDSNEDQRLPHHREPKEFVSLKQLEELGVLSWRLDADNYETDEELKKIREERGYSYMDFCEVSPEKLPNYEEKIKHFFEEHLHTDEEIRYAVAGSGYFDVRDKNDGWIRVWVKKGGMIVLPAGMYHRFTLDSDNYIKAMRLFVGDPVWTPFNRPHDHLPARKQYVEAFVQKERNDHAVNAAA